MGTSFEYQGWVSAQVNLGTTGDKATFRAGQPCEVVRWGFVADAAVTSGASAAVVADKSDYSGANRGAADGGSITFTADLAVDIGHYHEPAKPIELGQHQQLVFECTDAVTSGTVVLFVHYKVRPAHSDDKRTFAQGNLLGNLTKKAS